MLSSLHRNGALSPSQNSVFPNTKVTKPIKTLSTSLVKRMENLNRSVGMISEAIVPKFAVLGLNICFGNMKDAIGPIHALCAVCSKRAIGRQYV